MAALERWYFFSLLFLPETNDFANYMELMEKVSHVIPIYADVFWILQKDVLSNNEFFVWETYSVKNLSFVQPVPSSNINEPSYFAHLVKTKWSRRQDFRGSTVVATAVVHHYSCNFSFFHNRFRCEGRNGVKIWLKIFNYV